MDQKVIEETQWRSNIHLICTPEEGKKDNGSELILQTITQGFLFQKRGSEHLFLLLNTTIRPGQTAQSKLFENSEVAAGRHRRSS